VLTIRMHDDLLAAIDRYWHRQQLPSRVAGIRELIEHALAAAEAEEPKR
jgi:metal-responsive CopG/Arc/MetJ family transcriptional regulator